ncbi:nicotinate-nucleotide adenylyltransferase [Acidomonas methanolica]|uniref:Multifunctional fusion protein n=1 Tax=Acidomonas methanolica NBRC 104435 TaxID=1231351 RepID=A0A023D895_ACIMT|nr:nicotinate-nucleotide adenylyltransferase [Acidomonas methanolica]TCS26334.1 nicotinate-nucleotide adenylyltransferase [Acidomonas methanolica]GAJ30392.1 hypothetical protein Amme_131_002 [Acidomonas methanolica NBRC 104435]GBQ51965.1 nicotinic acid mononucleotide adenylyltransferase [Acidomonas methanolica]GEK99135.1 hypothetical protein AME01nite_16340 [Acidomonas methanolica NBRC 104435]
MSPFPRFGPLPRFGDGRRVTIGLLGGSFNPAHDGHLQLARYALRHLGLDQVWLMVSPGNPLKPAKGMAIFADRLASAERIADGRRIVATDIEARLGTRYTADTIARLRLIFPEVRFVWLMGADNLASFHHWRDWKRIAAMVAIAVVPRPGSTIRALDGQAAHALRRWRRPAREAPILAWRGGKSWTFLPAPQNGISATALRDSGITAALRATLPAGVRTIPRKSPSDSPTPPTRRASRAVQPAPVLAEAAKAPGTPRKKAAVAGPKRGQKVTREAAARDALDAVVAVVTASLADDKAEDIVVLDLTGRASFADRMVIATGLVDRQISAMAQHLERKLAEDAGIKRVLIEGANGSDWVLIDIGDVVVHLFKPESRMLYALERMWGADLDSDDDSVTTL